MKVQLFTRPIVQHTLLTARYHCVGGCPTHSATTKRTCGKLLMATRLFLAQRRFDVENHSPILVIPLEFTINRFTLGD